MDRQDRLQPERESRTSSPGSPPENDAENTVGPAEVTIRGTPSDEERHPASHAPTRAQVPGIPGKLEVDRPRSMVGGWRGLTMRPPGS